MTITVGDQLVLFELSTACLDDLGNAKNCETLGVGNVMASL